MIRKRYIIDNRQMRIKRGSFDLTRREFDGDFLELLPSLSPSITITSDLQPFEATEETPSDSQNYSIEGSGLFSTLRLYAPVNYQLSFNDITWSNTLNIDPTNGELSVTVYVRLNKGDVGTYDGNILHQAVGFEENLAVTGEVTQAATTINYGLLYNLSACNDGRGLVQTGWSIASSAKWLELINYLGIDYWDLFNVAYFNLKKNGWRNEIGIFQGKALGAYLFALANIREFQDSKSALFSTTGNNRAAGVRIYRAATVIEIAEKSDGDECDLYIGNDGKLYRTVYINEEVWIADNLAETKWSNGDWIKGFDGKYNDWFLPSLDELQAMHDNLHAEGVGGFQAGFYWTSSELSDTECSAGDVLNNNFGGIDKFEVFISRPTRTFQITESSYSLNLRDAGQAGGLIFYRETDGTTSTYYEAAPSDLPANVWSNIVDAEIGTTGTAIGTGAANTLAIIGQDGHTASAAQDCDDLEVIHNEGEYTPISNAAWAALDGEAALCAYEDDLDNVAVTGIIPADIEYSTFYLPSTGEYTAMFEQLDAFGLGNFDKTADAGIYWTSKGGGSGGTYVRWDAIEENYFFADNFENATELEFRPIRHFDWENNSDYPLRTEMPSGGYIFHIEDNGNGTFRHYESGPQDIGPQVFSNEEFTFNPDGPNIGDGLPNTNYIVGRVGHTTSAAQDCLDYEV
jgi:hypothetical protein